MTANLDSNGFLNLLVSLQVIITEHVKSIRRVFETLVSTRSPIAARPSADRNNSILIDDCLVTGSGAGL
jgi:hypothetical protein